MSWQPLSGVGGVPVERGPYEGVPSHLRIQLRLWAQQSLWLGMGYDVDLELRALAALRLDLPRGVVSQRAEVPIAFWKVIDEDDGRLLQLVHFLVYHQASQLESGQDWSDENVERLKKVEELLSTGGSVWTIATEGLTRRVDSAARAQFDQVVSAGDAASHELGEAWDNAYGFDPDPSDAWDHCIKALELLLKPIVLPNKPDATLGNVVGELASNRSTRGFVLKDNGSKNVTDPHDTLVGLLRMVWPNPDRHGGAHSTAPTVEEARWVLAATLTIAQWARGGLIH